MEELGVLSCPVCDQSRVIPMSEFADREAVKDCATDHLRTHRLNESERGIFRVAMAERIDLIETADRAEYATGAWTDELRTLTA